jgi:hypothetical protein
MTYLERLAALEARLRPLAIELAGLTDPDEPSGERWDSGQVWAHIIELVPYWTAEMRKILAHPGPEPLPFGRIKTDPGRISSIEAGRSRAPAEHWRLAGEGLQEFRTFLGGLDQDDMAKQGMHPRLGAITIERIIEEMVVGHLEQHAAQLEGLADLLE